MFFRNLTLFRFPVMQVWQDDDALQDLLAENALRPVGALELSSRGFVAPFGRDSTALAHRSGDALWLTVGGEDRILPAAVLNEALAKRLAEVARIEGRKPGARARKRLKDDLVHEMLPRAFVRPSRTDVAIDLQHGLCIVDTSSRRGGETAVAEIRHALGSFPALPLNAELAPRAVLTGWAAGERPPDGLTVGEECELRDPADHGAVVRCQRQDLFGQEVREHLQAGKQVSRLGLLLDDSVSFVLGEDLVIRKLRFLDGILDRLEANEREDLHAELDARFALQAATLRRLFDVLAPALRLSAVEG